MDTLQEFKETVAKIAELGGQVDDLAAQVYSEEGAAFAKMVELVKPVMRFIDYPIKTGAGHSGQQFHEWVYEYLSERGIVLQDKFSTRFTSGDTRGDYTGSMIVLCRSGRLVELARSGCWSNWQGEGSYWRAEEIEITPEDAVRICGLDELVSSLMAAFENAIEKSQKKQAILASRLKTVAKLKDVLA